MNIYDRNIEVAPKVAYFLLCYLVYIWSKKCHKWSKLSIMYIILVQCTVYEVYVLNH